MDTIHAQFMGNRQEMAFANDSIPLSLRRFIEQRLYEQRQQLTKTMTIFVSKFPLFSFNSFFVQSECVPQRTVLIDTIA
jgi:hypothetical protein